MIEPLGAPGGTCERCGSPLTWGRVRYLPVEDASSADRASGAWEGVSVTCAASLRSSSHPCAEARRRAVDRDLRPSADAVNAGAG